MKNILILGGGGFIGGHLAKKLKSEGNYIRIVDLKKHEYFEIDEICDDFVVNDLRNLTIVDSVMRLETYNGIPLPYRLNLYPFSGKLKFDEVYQLAADMGGAGYIFSGVNDADIMYNSSLINLNVLNCSIQNGIKKIFYSSSACIYPEHNQLNPEKPNCEESSAYPANPDSEYGWEKLFSERLYFAYNKNYDIDIKVARFHNIFGPYGTFKGGREKAPAAICRKIAEVLDGGEIEIWGDGKQTRSFLYIDECVEGIVRFMESNFKGPLNIGSDEMVTINDLVNYVKDISGKEIYVKHINGPTGVRGRNSDNDLIQEKLNWRPTEPLYNGLIKTYEWIKNNVK
jgi:nucleoside-diphosphate-sugar epimerase